MVSCRVKKNDIVIAVTGVNSGRTGKVLHIHKVKERAIVEGLNLMKKTLRKTQDNPQGGIVEKEGTIALSNLLLYCSECKKGVKTRKSKNEDRFVRNCKICGHSFDR